VYKNILQAFCIIREEGICYLGYEDGVDLGVVLEVLEDLEPFSLGCGAVQVGPGVDSRGLERLIWCFTLMLC